MATYKIRKIRQDENKVVTNVLIGNKVFMIEVPISLINSGQHEVLTILNEPLYVRTRGDTGTQYLTTSKDGTKINNFESLPKFKLTTD